MLKQLLKYATYLTQVAVTIMLGVIATMQQDDRKLMFAVLASVLFLGISTALRENK